MAAERVNGTVANAGNIALVAGVVGSAAGALVAVGVIYGVVITRLDTMETKVATLDKADAALQAAFQHHQEADAAHQSNLTDQIREDEKQLNQLQGAVEQFHTDHRKMSAALLLQASAAPCRQAPQPVPVIVIDRPCIDQRRIVRVKWEEDPFERLRAAGMEGTPW